MSTNAKKGTVANKRRKTDSASGSNQKKRKRQEKDQKENDPTKATTPPATLQAAANANEPSRNNVLSSVPDFVDDKPENKKRKRKQRAKKEKWTLPLEKIRVGFFAWHTPFVKGLKLNPRKCRIVEVSYDPYDYFPIRMEYLNSIISIRKETVRLVSGWTKPEYLEFEEKYKDLTIKKGLQCWHRPVYKGVVLPPQQCIVSDIDHDDPIKNISIKYTESEALVFGKMITFREGWINDRDLQFDCDIIAANQNFRIIEKLLEPDKNHEGKMCLKKQTSTVKEKPAQNQQNDGYTTPKKSLFRVGATAFHRAVIEGKETLPLEVIIMERDDEGTPRNCRIAYKDKEIEVGGQTHRLIGGWVSDTTLAPKATVWMHNSSVGIERKPREVRIVDINTEDSEVCIEYVHQDSPSEILGGWIPALDLTELDAEDAKKLRRKKATKK